jgi:hypothetical protein
MNWRCFEVARTGRCSAHRQRSRTKEQLFGRHPNNVEFLRSRLRKMSIHHPPHAISARNGLYLHFEGSEMADTYRITSHGPNFIINHDAGMTVGVYGTQQEALREIEACEQVWVPEILARQFRKFWHGLYSPARSLPG